MANVSLEGNERCQLLGIKTDKVLKNYRAIHDMHMYIIG
jgi:hypothetical protein